MKLARSIFCASAIGLAVSAAFANDYSAQNYGETYNHEYYAEERGLSTGPVPPSVDEGGVARNPSALNEPEVLIVEEHVLVAEPVIVAEPAVADPAAPIIVQGPQESVSALFDRYDVNRDGMISAQEARADPELQRWFTAADSDRNGALTPGEFDSAVQMAASEHRERMRQG